MEQTLRRALTQEERRLLKLWDLTCQSLDPAFEEEGRAPVDTNSYTGRFKVVAARGGYEVYFVCSKLMLRPVEVPDREAVLDFLSQDPILIDEMMIEQGIAAANIGRPSQIQCDVSVSEPILRSMGFSQP
jgi:hypothetical protein